MIAANGKQRRTTHRIALAFDTSIGTTTPPLRLKASVVSGVVVANNNRAWQGQALDICNGRSIGPCFVRSRNNKSYLLAHQALPSQHRILRWQSQRFGWILGWGLLPPIE
jgi:hypothetical protein